MTITEHATDFPVVWDDPADAERHWARDRMHVPDQITPLTNSVISACFPDGVLAAMEAFSAPIARWEFRRINTYAFANLQPRHGSPEEMAAEGAKAEAALGAAMGRLWEWWEGELLPEIHRHLGCWEAFDLPGASNDALLAHLDDTLARFRRLFEVHFLALLPSYVALSELEECYRATLGGSGAFDAYKLVGGHPNKTVEVGHQLWRLSREALAAPEVATVLRDGGGPEVVLAELRRTAAGVAFAARLEAYLDEFGQRGDLFFDLDRPAWVEDPTPALESLRHYMSQPDSADPALVAAGLATEREAALAAARERFATCPEATGNQFEFLLRAATAGVMISEDHGFWIDFRSSYKVRRVLCEFGRRLAAGDVIDRPEDVFMLTVDELRAATAGTAHEWRGLVAERRAEMERFASIRPPDTIGAPPPPPPPTENPFTRSLGKFFGAPPAEDSAGDDPGVVRGNPGAPGRVKGVARVIRSITEADRVQPGDILVAETTTPPWTALFAVAAGVVTDTGGVLSHCAVVAREYGVPAVVGTVTGTDRIDDGMLIEVDGDAGVVHLPSG
ncbi:MAG: PEP-utilizing enzyme [Acidimicrobiia bacterium]